MWLVREGFSEEVTFELRPEGKQGARHVRAKLREEQMPCLGGLEWAQSRERE